MSEKSSTGPEAATPSVDDTEPVPSILSEIGDQVRKVGAQVAEGVTELAHQAQTRGASIVGEVKDRVADSAEVGKETVAGGLEDVSEAMHQAGEQLEGHQDWIAQLVESGANELGTLAATLRTNDLHGLTGKLTDLARRRPAIFVGAAMAAGFATVRLGKVAVAGASRANLPNLPEVGREPN